MNTYFITGATGVVGSEIAGRLLTATDGRLVLLMRASDDVQAAARLDALAAYWRVDEAMLRDRVEVVRGDATLPRFGLSEAQWQRLAEATTHVIHCAALVRMNLPLEEALQAAVRSAENVLELAQACRTSGQLEKVEFLSTVGVAGRRPGTLPERWVNEPRAFHNTYEEAKARAETLVAQACDAGLPVTVFRPSMVVGAADTGRILRFQVFYHLVEFLSGRRTRGLYPALGATRLDLVPVDYVARAVTWSGGTRETAGRILHLCSGPSAALPLVQLRDIVRARLRAHGERLAPVISIPPALLRAAIPVVRAIVPAEAKRALGTLPVFLDYLEGEQSFGNAETTALLARAGLHAPAPRDYIETVLDYYFERRASAG